jgi:hypothetical protein
VPAHERHLTLMTPLRSLGIEDLGPLLAGTYRCCLVMMTDFGPYLAAVCAAMLLHLRVE